MARPPAVRLVQACESMCEELRRTLGLTAFRAEIARPSTPLVVSMRAPDPIGSYDPRNDWLRPKLPAAMDLRLQAGARILVNIHIEDLRRERYPEQALEEGQRIVDSYAPELVGLLEESAR